MGRQQAPHLAGQPGARPAARLQAQALRFRQLEHTRIAMREWRIQIGLGQHQGAGGHAMQRRAAAAKFVGLRDVGTIQGQFQRNHPHRALRKRAREAEHRSQRTLDDEAPKLGRILPLRQDQPQVFAAGTAGLQVQMQRWAAQIAEPGRGMQSAAQAQAADHGQAQRAQRREAHAAPGLQPQARRMPGVLQEPADQPAFVGQRYPAARITQIEGAQPGLGQQGLSRQTMFGGQFGQRRGTCHALIAAPRPRRLGNVSKLKLAGISGRRHRQVARTR
mmetsp:Transcript_53763/g.126805  ORF Transcript_53763/g.126805 Transcript_53763/m.126805 type:complete len:276 (+) Transcript_53763:1181-2008(+)